MADYGVTYWFTQRNKPILTYERNFYKPKKGKDEVMQTWICVHGYCRGSLQLDPDGKPNLLTEHNELEVVSELEYNLEMAKYKLRSLTMDNPDWSAVKIVETLVESVNPLCRHGLPLKASMIANVRRWRQPKRDKASETKDDTNKEVDENDRTTEGQVSRQIERPKKPKGSKHKVFKRVGSGTMENDGENGEMGGDENAPVVDKRIGYLVAGGSPTSEENGLTKVHQPRTKLIAFNQKRRRSSSDTEMEVPQILKSDNRKKKK